MNEPTDIFDLRGLILRSYHSGTDPDARTSALGASLNTPGFTVDNFLDRHLLPILAEQRLNRVICVRDAGNEYRKRLYPDYKKHRKEADEELVLALAEAQRAVEGLLLRMGLPFVQVAGVEADDVLAYLCQKLPGAKRVHTRDNDLVQLANDDTLVLVAGVAKEEWAVKDLENPVPARHVALYKSLCGDSSDGYSGVKGFGPKAYQGLLEEFGEEGLDDLVEIAKGKRYADWLWPVAKQTGNKALGKLYAQREEWTLGWKLANLAPWLVGSKAGKKFRRLEWAKRLPDRRKVLDTLERVGCADRAEDLEPYLPRQEILSKHRMQLTANKAAEIAPGGFLAKALESGDVLGYMAAQFAKSPFVSLDWETTDKLQWGPFKRLTKSTKGEFVDTLSSEITGAGFTFGANLEHTIYLPFDHLDPDGVSNLPRDFLLEVLKRIPEDKPIALHNGQFELNILKNTLGYELPNCHDTMVMASHVDENNSKGLKDLSLRWLGYKQAHYADVVEKGKTMSDYTVEHCFSYGADDPLATAHLYDLFKVITQIEGSWAPLVRDYEFPAIYELSDAFLDGVSIDVDLMRKQGAEDKDTLDTSLALIRAHIKANQTEESIRSGAARLHAEFWPLRQAKLRVKGHEDFEEEKAAYLDLWTKRVRYEDYTKIEKTFEFSPTALQIDKVLTAYGLPTLHSFRPGKKLSQVSAALLTEYLTFTEAKADDRHRAFLDLLAGAHRWFVKDRTEPAYRAFEQACLDAILSGMAEADRYEMRGFEMNLDSPPQMQALLYGMLDLPVRMRAFEFTDTQIALGFRDDTHEKPPQTNKDAVAYAIAEDAPEGSWKRECLEALEKAARCATRLKMFYGAYPDWVHPRDGNIHPQINVVGTETRRPSGSAPNALQWPKRGEGKKFRYCILPDRNKGHNLVGSLDFAQQELRIGAGLSRDVALLDCYFGYDVVSAVSAEVRSLLGERLYQQLILTPTKDVHTQTAAGILRLPYDTVEAVLKDKSNPLYAKAGDTRTKAKPVNFGSAYGIGAAKLLRQIKEPKEVAQKFLDDKKAQYHGFERWREAVIAEAHAKGEVRTLLGGVRHVHDQIEDPDRGVQSSVERQIVNALIQGLAGNILKRTLAEVSRRKLFRQLDTSLIAPPYDEMAISYNDRVAVPLNLELHEIMTRDIPGLPVPMLVEVSLGPNFGHQIELKNGAFPTKETILEAVEEALNYGK